MQLTVTFLRIILGVMAGMSRDKCGSGVVAGFLQCVAKLKPKGIKVIGGMAMVSQSIFIALLTLILFKLLLFLFNLIFKLLFLVRNSVGANCYVSNEIITSRHGVRLRVGNTDAEVLIFYMNIIDNEIIIF